MDMGPDCEINFSQFWRWEEAVKLLAISMRQGSSEQVSQLCIGLPIWTYEAGKSSGPEGRHIFCLHYRQANWINYGE